MSLDSNLSSIRQLLRDAMPELANAFGLTRNWHSILVPCARYRLALVRPRDAVNSIGQPERATVRGANLPG